jgi:multidrug resistance efflux pump
MAEQDDGSGWKSSTRGEQAWKEAMEGVASRNAAARKAGKLEREEYEREREDVRRAAAARRQAQYRDRRTR